MSLALVLNALLMIVIINLIPISKPLTKTRYFSFISDYTCLSKSCAILCQYIDAPKLNQRHDNSVYCISSTRKPQDDNTTPHGAAKGRKLTKNCRQVYGLSAQRAEGTAPL
jgi:hypothetical protein